MSDYKIISDYIKTLGLKNYIKTIVEFGSRDGLDAVFLAEEFPKANIYTFECNPRQENICKSNIKLSNNSNRIFFVNKGVGEDSKRVKFFHYPENIGASSLYIHNNKLNKDDFSYIDLIRPESYFKKNRVSKIDLLCMDIQGYELFALKGLGNYLYNIDFIQTEIYKDDRSNNYIGSPKRSEVISLLKDFTMVGEKISGNEGNAIFIKGNDVSQR